jgi:hypothetical protein
MTKHRTVTSQDIASTGRIISQALSVARTKVFHSSITQDARSERFDGTSEGSSDENLAATGAFSSDAVGTSQTRCLRTSIGQVCANGSFFAEIYPTATNKDASLSTPGVPGEFGGRRAHDRRSSSVHKDASLSTPGVPGEFGGRRAHDRRSSSMHQAFMKNCRKRKSLRARVPELESCREFY